MRKDNNGFTLIEMMIVVSIIAILATVAVPYMMRARVQANEAAAISDLRIIAGAEISYNTSRHVYGDFDSLTSTTDGTGTEFLSTGWADGRKKEGYVYTMPEVDAYTFTCYADPVSLGQTGTRYFRVDESGIVRYNSSSQPVDSDSAVGS